MSNLLQIVESPKVKAQKSKTFRVLYCHNRRNLPFETPTHYDSDNYTMVGRFKVEDLQDLFHFLNDALDEPNPLGCPESQLFIRKHLLHTSMSVGDIAIDESDMQAYYCASIGWQPILKREF